MATPTARGGAAGGAGAGTAPRQASLVLLTLIAVAAVANLNLTVANVTLRDIGRAFDTGQTTLDPIAIGYSLGLAGSVLHLGAVGDRYGRRMMLAAGVLLSVPACLMAAHAPDAGVLLAGRLLGGISAGLAYPTTLALIPALWLGPARIRPSPCGPVSDAPSPTSCWCCGSGAAPTGSSGWPSRSWAPGWDWQARRSRTPSQAPYPPAGLGWPPAPPTCSATWVARSC